MVAGLLSGVGFEGDGGIGLATAIAESEHLYAPSEDRGPLGKGGSVSRG